MTTRTVTVDVREDIRAGREPFTKIMNAAAALRPEEQLLLIAPFEPVPLFGVMEKQGFRHTERTTASGEWEVLFTRQSGAILAEAAPKAGAVRSDKTPAVHLERVLEVDARGLEPPQPMVKILELVATLPADTSLSARTDRRPMHLYPHLEQRGFLAATEEQSDGSFLTHIRRR